MAKLTVRDLDVRGKRVLVRADFNVPLEARDGQMVITDATRIKETLPTLDLLIHKGARIILASHLGRPDGKREAACSLRPVAAKLADMLGCDVNFADDCIGENVEKMANALPDGGILLLENLRFYPEEESKDEAVRLPFAEKLGRLAEVYVNDAFGAAHRAHASTVTVAKVVAARGGPCAAGLLMERELKFLGEALENPARPFVVVLGGAKVSDKIKVINRLIDKADALLIGGAMACTFMLAHGQKTGKSLVEPECKQTALDAEAKAKQRNVQFLLPTDAVIATPVDSGKRDSKGRPRFDYVNPRTVSGDVPDDSQILDIGPATAKRFAGALHESRTILWNGPMGMFEDKRFAAGTEAVARAVAASTQAGATSIIGGGDSVKALNQLGLGGAVTFMSTGGGASLEFLEGKELPGVAVLNDK
jgi:phosphoglycerate kinase